MILFSSLKFARKFRFEVFQKVHFILALTTIGGLIWHLLTGEFLRVVAPVTALLLWLFNLAFSADYLFQIICNFLKLRRRTLDQEAIIYRIHGALKVELTLQRSLSFVPGQYGYLYLPEIRRFQSHPFVIAWWDDSLREVNSGQTKTTLSFLIEPQKGITEKLLRRTSVRGVIFDGPYGQHLHLDEYDNVTLVAQGIGIAGILPHVRHLSKRRFHEDPVYQRGLVTRRVNLFWILDNDYEVEWVSDFFLQLQEEDKHRVSYLFCLRAC